MAFSEPTLEEVFTYKSIILGVPYLQFKELEGKQPPHAEWQEFLVTWIAATEKARKGKSLDKHCQVRFHWSGVEKEEG